MRAAAHRSGRCPSRVDDPVYCFVSTIPLVLRTDSTSRATEKRFYFTIEDRQSDIWSADVARPGE
jgi:hypothetical protein